MQITIEALTEHLTPAQAEKQHGFSPGFSEAVKNIRKQAEGKWGWCTVKVTVTTKEGTGTDYLGMCSYLNAADFVENSGYFGDMVSAAIESQGEDT